MIKFENSVFSSVFIMPKEAEKHIKNAGTAELRVLFHIFASCGMTGNEADIAAAVGITESEVYSALAFWRGTGIITYKKDETPPVRIVSETKPSEKSISYSSGELADAIESNEDIRSLLNFASMKLEKILTPGEQAGLYSLVDAMSMSCELVMGIIEYCVSEGKKSVRYIERTAVHMHDEDGIDTYEKLEEYIDRKAKERTVETKIRRIIGCENRGFTAKEKKIIEQFTADGISEELIAAAYERTINNISKPSLVYMSKIIDNWKSQGIKSLSDIEGQMPFSEDDIVKIGKDGVNGAFRLEDFTEKPDDDLTGNR